MKEPFCVPTLIVSVVPAAATAVTPVQRTSERIITSIDSCACLREGLRGRPDDVQRTPGVIFLYSHYVRMGLQAKA